MSYTDESEPEDSEEPLRLKVPPGKMTIAPPCVIQTLNITLNDRKNIDNLQDGKHITIEFNKKIHAQWAKRELTKIDYDVKGPTFKTYWDDNDSFSDDSSNESSDDSS